MRILALVDVRAISSGAIQLVALLALAAEHTEYVLAATEHAEIAEHFAFVYVHAGLLVVLVGMHEAHLALAAERPGVIEAASVLAESIVIGAFVDVLAGVAVASEASVANALEQSRIFSLSSLLDEATPRRMSRKFPRCLP